MSDTWPTQQTPNGISSDGTQLVFDRDSDLMLLDLDGSHRVTPLVETPSREVRATLSPDGRWLAYHSDESGSFEVYVRPFPNSTDWREPISNAGGFQPWWSRARDELFYFAPGGELMSVLVNPAENWSSGRPTVVFENRQFLFGETAASTFDVSGDGQRFLMVQRDVANRGTASPQITVVQRFDEELTRLVPVP